MIEMMFGGGSPMWTTVPSMGYQPTTIGNGPLAAPLFGPPHIAGGLASMPSVSQAVSPPNGLLPALYGPDLSSLVTPASLLTAVALRRGQPQGPANDQEVEEFLYDALELLPGAGDVEVRCESGRATLTGSVPHKRTKHDAGEIAWAIPGLQDIQNNISITSRRRSRAGNRDADATAAAASTRKG